jgi:hypothetical protein
MDIGIDKRADDMERRHKKPKTSEGNTDNNTASRGRGNSAVEQPLEKRADTGRDSDGRIQDNEDGTIQAKLG